MDCERYKIGDKKYSKDPECRGGWRISYGEAEPWYPLDSTASFLLNEFEKSGALDQFKMAVLKVGKWSCAKMKEGGWYCKHEDNTCNDCYYPKNSLTAMMLDERLKRVRTNHL